MSYVIRFSMFLASECNAHTIQMYSAIKNTFYKNNLSIMSGKKNNSLEIIELCVVSVSVLFINGLVEFM